MTIDRQARRPTAPTRATPATEMKRIPLPPLPHFQRPQEEREEGFAPQNALDAAARPAPSAGPAGAVSHVEMSELLAPGHEGGISPAIEAALPQRTGATGARILNDLVDEIEKGLERELARAPIEITSQGYRRVVTCASGPALSQGGPAPGAPPRPGHPGRSDA